MEGDFPRNREVVVGSGRWRRGDYEEEELCVWHLERDDVQDCHDVLVVIEIYK